MRRIGVDEIPHKYPGALEWFDTQCARLVEHVVRFYERMKLFPHPHDELIAVASIERAGTNVLNRETREAVWLPEFQAWLLYSTTIVPSRVVYLVASDELIEIGAAAYFGAGDLVYAEEDDEDGSPRQLIGRVVSTRHEGGDGDRREWGRTIVGIELRPGFVLSDFWDLGGPLSPMTYGDAPPTKWVCLGRYQIEADRAASLPGVEVV